MTGGPPASKTDKTRPWWVRLVEHGIAVHDHRDGVCDLETGRDAWQGAGHCYLDYSPLTIKGTCCSGCGCRSEMCSGRDDRKRQTRRERYAGRREARTRTD